ncbi:hypothetical protein [Streptomyces sp. NPDC050485]|uniref:hypothetical protein n=1 Tax=Streptomyces sp. NPDC050485 TaxID=3365617 RepID=UPI003797D5E6
MTVPLSMVLIAMLMALIGAWAGEITRLVMGGSRWLPASWGASGAVSGGLAGYVVSPLYPDDRRLSLVQTAAAVGCCCLVMAALALYVHGHRRRKMRRARGYAERSRALWEPLADRVAAQENEAHGGRVITVRELFDLADQAMADHEPEIVLEHLRKAMIRMVIALRSLVRMHPDNASLATALTAVLAVRDQLIAQTAAHRAEPVRA